MKNRLVIVRDANYKFVIYSGYCSYFYMMRMLRAGFEVEEVKTA